MRHTNNATGVNLEGFRIRSKRPPKYNKKLSVSPSDWKKKKSRGVISLNHFDSNQTTERGMTIVLEQ